MEVNFKDVLRPISSVFANKVISYLVNQYGFDDICVTECQFFTNDIGEAVITISNVFQREYRKTFYYLHESLENPERFEEYCMLIPVMKDENYLYNFLRRISLIFELAKYCCQYIDERNKGYFEIAAKCIENYPDLIYFNKVGGLESLKHIASFLAKIDPPLKLIMRKDFLQDENIETFSDVLKKLRQEYLFSKNYKMLHSNEMECLENLCRVFSEKDIAKSVTKEKSLNPQKHSPGKEKDSSKIEKEILMNYFESCINFEKRDVVQSSGHESGMPPSEKKLKLCKSLSRVLYNATVLIRDLTIIKDLEKESQEIHEDASEEKSIKAQGNTSFTVECDVSNVDESGSLTDRSKKVVDSCSSKIDQHLKSSCVKDSGKLEESSDDEIRTVGEFCSRKLERRISVIQFSGTSGSEKTSPASTDPGKESGAGPITRKTEMFAHEHEKSSGDHAGRSETAEAECSLAVDGEDIKYSFIVPDEYFHREWDSDECKYLYSARINPPSKKERMTEPLKKILSTNVAKKNYRLMTSGDSFVGPPNFSEEETLYVFIDSSNDEEGDEDLDRLICLFKKRDLDHEIRNLTPRKPGYKNESKKSSSESPQKPSRKLKHPTDADVADTAYVKYLTGLYKKHLPLLLESVKRNKLDSRQNRPFFLAGCEDYFSSMPETSTIFVIDTDMLAKLTLELYEQRKCDDVLGLLESTDSITQFSTVILPPQEDSELKSFISSSRYRNIHSSGVYVLGEFANETKVWYIFESMKKDTPVEEHNSGILRMAKLYREAVDKYYEFNNRSREFIATAISSLQSAVIRPNV